MSLLGTFLQHTAWWCWSVSYQEKKHPSGWCHCPLYSCLGLVSPPWWTCFPCTSRQSYPGMWLLSRGCPGPGGSAHTRETKGSWGTTPHSWWQRLLACTILLRAAMHPLSCLLSLWQSLVFALRSLHPLEVEAWDIMGCVAHPHHWIADD